MLETLLGWTALPNLHPALVHFPIALAGVALLFDVLSLVRRGEDRGSALVLWWLAAAGAGAAYLAGRAAADGLGVLAPEIETAIGLHSDWAWWTLGGLLGVAVLRSLALLDWGGRPLYWLGLAAGLAVQLLILRTADLGGALVFRHGVAVTRDVAAPEPARSAPLEFVRRADGSWTWTPSAGDSPALARVLEQSEGGSLDVQVVPGGPGLRIRVTGAGRLLLPGDFTDLRVEGELDVTGFDGTVGLAVFARERDDALVLEREPAGRLALLRSRRGAQQVLAEARSPVARGRLQLALSVVGGHWKGYESNESLVHSHGSFSGTLRPALVLRGDGELTVLSLGVTSMADPEGRDSPSH